MALEKPSKWTKRSENTQEETSQEQKDKNTSRKYYMCFVSVQGDGRVVWLVLYSNF